MTALSPFLSLLPGPSSLPLALPLSVLIFRGLKHSWTQPSSPEGSLCPPPARVALLSFGLFPFMCPLTLGAGVAASPVPGPAGEGMRPRPGRRACLPLLHATSPVIPCAHPSSLSGRGAERGIPEGLGEGDSSRGVDWIWSRMGTRESWKLAFFFPLEGADSWKGTDRVDAAQVPLADARPSDRILGVGWVGAAEMAALRIVRARVPKAISSCSVNTWC